VAQRFGSSPATVPQMSAEVRAGTARFHHLLHAGSEGGPRKQALDPDRVLELRAARWSVDEVDMSSSVVRKCPPVLSFLVAGYRFTGLCRPRPVARVVMIRPGSDGDSVHWIPTGWLGCCW
jgi:hypothetical protein